MKIRCAWAKDDLNIKYHDNEWGIPQHNDQKLFEFLVLEGARLDCLGLLFLKDERDIEKHLLILIH